jgi:hypothetical protein
MADQSCSCVGCGRPLKSPKEGFAFDDDWLIKKRIKLDNHMQTNHPNHTWTPISLAMIRDEEDKHELAQMLLVDPHVQFRQVSHTFNVAADAISIVDEPWSAKTRKLMTDKEAVCKCWERITNQLLVLQHRDSDMMWSLIVRYTCSGLPCIWIDRQEQLDDAWPNLD